MARPYDTDGMALVRVIHLPDLATVVLDIAMWAVIHAGTGYFVHRLDPRVPVIASDQWWSRLRRFDSRLLYDRVLHIKRWKDRLPEAGACFAGGVSKRALPAHDAETLRRYAVETRRAELGHWLAALAGPAFALWNPPAVAVFMVGYGLAANLPCIAIQRYNRVRIERIVRRRLVRA